MARRKKDNGISTGYEQLSFFDFTTTDLLQQSIQDVTEYEFTNVLDTVRDKSDRPDSSRDSSKSRDVQTTGTRTTEQVLSDKSKESDGDVTSNSEERFVSTRENDGVHQTIIGRNYYSNNDKAVDERLNSKQKCKNNLEAIRVLEQLEKENRLANRNEQQTLSRYSGWGGLPHIFNENDSDYEEERTELKNLISIEEYQTAKSSVLTSFYTPSVIIRYMYQYLNKMGFTTGKILEPSMGIGGFFNGLPAEMQASSLTGVELDRLSGKIAKHLFPESHINVKGFEQTLLPKNYYDLSITNVPFGNFKIHDLDWNHKSYDIHNYFFVKALEKVRAGGLLAFITTTETMDGRSDVLEELHKNARLLGAIRLPNNTFRINGANTDVTSDIILLQKLEENEINHDVTWLEKVPYGNRYLNKYFYDNPDMVLGNIVEVTNQYGKPELTCKSDGRAIEDCLESIMNKLPSNIYQEEIFIEKDPEHLQLDVKDLEYRIDEFFIRDNHLYQRKEDYLQAINKSDKDYVRIEGLVSLSLQANELIDMQIHDVDDITFQQALTSFNEDYDKFVKRFGYLGSRTNAKAFGSDPNYYLLNSLETIDTSTKEVSKAKFFFERTIKPKVEIKHVESVYDALELSLNNKGKLDFDYMEILLSKDKMFVINELLKENKIFHDPQKNEYVLDEEYLSGNIREKLRYLEEYYPDDEKYSANKILLTGILPEWLDATDIKAQLGATFIPERYVKEFACKIFNFEDQGTQWCNYRKLNISYSEIIGTWIFSAWNDTWDTMVNEEWGVPEDDEVDDFYSQPSYNGFRLFEDTLNSKIPTIKDYWDEEEDGDIKRKSRINVKRTAYARDLQERLLNEFEEWVYEDVERRDAIEKVYNERFNSFVIREYDGQYLSFPEMNMSYKLEPYQKNAVSRIMHSNSTLLSQVVGAGKTFEMIASGMEMKRLGMRNKCLYVVPNHLVGQWGSDFKALYPQANILVATKKDFEKSNRQKFYHKIATNDYDAIIMAHSSFKLIPMSVSYQERHLKKEYDELVTAIEDLIAEEVDTFTGRSKNTKQIKVLERSKKAIEANMQKLTDIKRDNGLTFDKLGIDYIFVDEAHEFKNLYIYSQMNNISGVPQVKSQKASDMYMKTQFIKENDGGICFATGTPISNTMAELYTMQRYLQKERLEEMNIHCFDAWAKMFGKVVNSFEISVDGSSFQSKQRFNKFFNVTELMTTFKDVAEITTKSMLSKFLENSVLGRVNAVPPKHAGGKPIVVSMEASGVLEDYIADVVERTEAIHDGGVNPKEDNMLKVTTDSKKASIDMRLIDESFGELENNKLSKVTDTIASVYFKYDNDNATQLVFCDSSTPKEDKFNVYTTVKNSLIERGIPENEIEFIHDANTENKKVVLFDKMNKGEVRVLLGSTAKLGAGTNVQQRLIAIHHIDVPWRASDIEQRNGRGFRQGNMYDEIFEYRYVTQKSFDAYSWQMIETKSTYMNQLLEGEKGIREIEEDDASILSYAEVKAIASGNPLIKEKMEVDNEVRRLDSLKSQYLKKKHKAEKDIISLPFKIEKQEILVSKLKKDVSKANSVTFTKQQLDENFNIAIDSKVFTTVKECGAYLNDKIKNFEKINNAQHILGTLESFEFGVKYGQGRGWILFLLGEDYSYTVDDWHEIGRVNFNRLLEKIHKLPVDFDCEQRSLESMYKADKEIRTLIEKPWDNDDLLKELKTRQKELNKLLTSDKGTGVQMPIDDEECVEENELE